MKSIWDKPSPLILHEDRKHKPGEAVGADDVLSPISPETHHVSKPPVSSYFESLDKESEAHTSPSHSPRFELFGPLRDPAPTDTLPMDQRTQASEYGTGSMWTGTHPPNTVVVFGFPRDRADAVLSWMQKEGEILRRQDDAGNWTYLTYATPLQMKWAEEQNGVVLEGNLMIGVKRAGSLPTGPDLRKLEEEEQEPSIFHRPYHPPVSKSTSDQYPQLRRSAWASFVEHVLNW